MKIIYTLITNTTSLNIEKIMKEYKAGIYLRLSKEHLDENNSIEAQREITTGYAIKNGYKVICEYVDNGYSGILDSRPALNRMIRI